jgi:hypothetical protein
MTRGNLRLITKEVDPRNLAIWTFGALEACLREWAYEVYDSSDHPALGQSPREAFLMAQVLKGARLNRAVYPNEEFEMLTLPTTARGAARVMAGRGVKINYIYYCAKPFVTRMWKAARFRCATTPTTLAAPTPTCGTIGISATVSIT